MVKENLSKKGKALKKSRKPRKDSKPKKDQGHEFRCVPKSVAVIFKECLNKNPEKKALVEEMGFGVLSNIPNYYLKQKVLKEVFNHFDMYDNTIHAVTGEVEITTKKIGDALSLFSIGTSFPDKVIPKDLSKEDYAVCKFFQGKTQAALSKLIMDTNENKRLFMRAFILFIQKCFLLATSSTNVTPRAYPTLFDVENTKQRNWALYVHNFLLEEIKKARENNMESVHGCCYAMLGLARTGKMIAEKERLQKKNPKNMASSKSEWESKSETKFEESNSEESYKDSDYEETRSEELVLQQSEDPTLAEIIRRIRKRKNQEKEERNNKKRKQPNENSPMGSANVEPEHEPPQQSPQQEEETLCQQPQQEQLQQTHQTHQDKVIELSSSSEDEHLPGPIKDWHPLVPKVKEDHPPNQEDQPPEVVEQPSQTIVEVVPVYPTHEVIDVSSGFEDEQQPLIPKTKEDLVYSSSSKIITDVLMSMNQERQQDFAPSFDLGIKRPLLTTQDLSDIEELDDLYRMFEMHGDNWMDKKKKRPYDISTWVNYEEYMIYLDKDKLLTNRFLFAPIMCSKHWWLYVMDVEKKDFFILDSKNIVSPTYERMIMNRFASNILDQMLRWAGAPSMFKKGSCSLLSRYINITGQPNETDCGIYVMKWMELIDPTAFADCCEA
ncbi:hypothetical protein PIB30_046609 [Stylosanthes scabra]|uniref:Ubiquitin-like protease family profile domain-containing protein n=1 Tax=Stylosanthes scabra TaxID=79078 RepID=A0ABU6THB3_9FABA|nr:hypothetical protein [Stylosanthes scabra]